MHMFILSRKKRISGVMVSMLVSSVVDYKWVRAPVGSNQTIKLVFITSPLSTQH
jgi:hypothetical protein